MSKYLGKIEIKNYYVNFIPLYLLENGLFIQLTTQDKQDLTNSEYSNINLYSSKANYHEFSEEFSEDLLYILDIDSSAFEDNITRGEINSKTRYKIDVSKLDTAHFGTVEQFGYYYYVNSADASGSFGNTSSFISDPLIKPGFQVVIETNDQSTVAGPFTVNIRTQDNAIYCFTHRSERNNDLFIVNTIIRTQDPNELQKITVKRDECYYLFCSKDKTRSCLDVMSDEELLKQFRDSLKNRVASNGMISLKNIESIVDSYNVNGGSNVPREIKTNRIERLKDILLSEKELDAHSEDINRLIADILVNNYSSESLTDVFGLLSENQDFISVVPQISVLRAKIQQIEDLVVDKEHELELLETKISSKKEEELEASFTQKYNELREQITAAQAEYNLLKEHISVYEGAMSDQEYLKHLKEEISYYERLNSDRKVESELIEKNIDNIFNARTEKALDLTFDGMISQKMIQAAAEWETDREDRQYKEVVGIIADHKNDSMSKKELIDYLCETVNTYRPDYDRNTVLNLFICLAQGFLTVFSGAPGAGKTSVCSIIAHTLGLRIPSSYVDHEIRIDSSRYIDISVERGWTSKRDFIGYYNPLTKKFDRNNSRLFDALNILNIEATDTRTNRPFVILLDEANLSPMEYYWADFMNVCDDLNKNSSIDLGESYRFIIPDELRFIATINNDHTTESLSPRLIDRAWVIRLPNVQQGQGKPLRFKEDDNREILWDDFISVFGSEKQELVGTAKEIYEGFIAKSKKVGIRVSPRSDSAIRRYWSVASELMVKDDNVMVDPSIIALDYAISQKILPQISGSGDVVEDGLKELRMFSQEKNLSMTALLLGEIITRGENTMRFFQYFG